MRVLHRLARAAACALLLAACSGPAGSNTANGHNAWSHPGELRYGSAYEPDTLNPLLANTQAAPPSLPSSF